MKDADPLSLFTLADYLALAFLVAAYLGTSFVIDRENATRKSVATQMAFYRRRWMEVFAGRDARIFDAAILSSLRQGTSFFASACMIAIGGGAATLANPERLAGVARELSLDQAPATVWELKLIVALALVSNAFLKFVWSHRLFGYCAILMASVPEIGDAPEDVRRAEAARAAQINISAARSFNRGLRSVYFALASLAWLAGPLGLAIGTVVTTGVLWRREFASNSRAAILR